MTDSEDMRWEERARRLGLNPSRLASSWRRLVVAEGIEDLTEKLNAPVLAEQEPTLAPTGPDVRQASDLLLRLATVRHVLGMSQITDRDALAEIDRRFVDIPLDALTQGPGPVTVTAQNPLIINSIQSVTNFTTVILDPGGYIEISIDCLFQAQRLVKSGDAEAAPGAIADITITGTPGVAGAAGTPGTAGDAGGDGTGGSCCCCGGTVMNNGTQGATGGTGTSGAQGANGKSGNMGPTVVIKIDDLASTVSLTNVGGTGGDGGNGGNGGNGGAGGNGGSDVDCGATRGDGGWGGNGGNGANGGNGGNSGDGGLGGTSSVFFKSKNGSTFLVSNAAAPAGTPGTGGTVGTGGAGGKSGGRGAQDGNSGSPGTTPGTNGTSGVPGRPGTVKVNPTVV